VIAVVLEYLDCPVPFCPNILREFLALIEAHELSPVPDMSLSTDANRVLFSSNRGGY